jgi:hypothetical protein
MCGSFVQRILDTVRNYWEHDEHVENPFRPWLEQSENTHWEQQKSNIPTLPKMRRTWPNGHMLPHLIVYKNWFFAYVCSLPFCPRIPVGAWSMGVLNTDGFRDRNYVFLLHSYVNLCPWLHNRFCTLLWSMQASPFPYHEHQNHSKQRLKFLHNKLCIHTIIL